MSIRFPTVDWLQGANIYEVNIRQYTKEGTFKSFTKHLPRLKKMGVSILWLMPITPISLKKRKGSLGSYYACSSYTDINPEFGDKDDFKDLVDQAHHLGFKLIIDWVANHSGWDHKWTEKPDWYVKDAAGNFTEIHGWDDVIDLNYDQSEMQSAMIDAMKYWVGVFDIDGFRCDMAHLVNLGFWQQARGSLEKIKQLLWLGECDEDNYSDVFDITYAWRWMHATEKFAKDQTNPATFKEIKQALHNYQNLPPGAKKLYFTSNHDENSWNGTEYEKYGEPLVYTLAAFTCLFPGIPLIYSGQELPNKKRLKFFDKDEIDWNNGPSLELETFYRILLEVRKSCNAFSTNSNFTWLEVGPDRPLLAFFLESTASEPARALILINLSSSETSSFTIAEPLSKKQLQGEYSAMTLNYPDHPDKGPVTQTGKTQVLSPGQSFQILPGDIQVYVSQNLSRQS